MSCHDNATARVSAPCARRVFSVLALESRLHVARVHHGSDATLGDVDGGGAPTPSLRVRVNGIAIAPAPGVAALALPLRRGVNTVDVSSWRGLAALEVEGAAPPPAHGAALPFTEVEAEDAARTTGVLVGPSTTFGDLAAEASARRAVALVEAGQFVEFVVPVPTDAISIRASIPDAAAGGGIETPLALYADGELVANVTLTSHYSWLYGSYPFTRNPADGRAHHFFDDAEVMLPTRLAAGSLLRLQRPAPTERAAPTERVAAACSPVPPPASARRDCGYNGIDEATCLARGCCWTVVDPNPTHIPYCFFAVTPPPPPPLPGNVTITLDVVHFWSLDGPAPAPSGALSVVATGADPSGVRDSSQAFVAAIAQAAGRVVWVPPGRYLVTQRLLLGDNVTLVGAGPWWSVLAGAGAGLVGSRAPHPSVDVGVHGLAVIGDVRIRNDSSPLVGIGGAFTDSVIANVFIRHEKCGMWLDGPFAGLLITGVDIRNTMADGVNFHGAVVDSVVEQSYLRNLGDDGLASWSDARVAQPTEGLASSDRRSSSRSSSSLRTLNATASPNVRNALRNNTIVLPILANHIAIYGGESCSATFNTAVDSLTEGGAFHVGNRFTSVPASGVTVVSDNVAVRAGCTSTDYPADLAALWFFALEAPLDGGIMAERNALHNSSRSAVLFVAAASHAITGVTIADTVINGTGAFAFELVATAGHASVSGVLAMRVGAVAGAVNNCTIPLSFSGGGNAGWATSTCAPRLGGAGALPPFSDGGALR